jgi:hypothetical protein
MGLIITITIVLILLAGVITPLVVYYDTIKTAITDKISSMWGSVKSKVGL